MQTFSLTPAQLFDNKRHLLYLAATSSLAGVKLSRIRVAVASAAADASAALDALAQGFATKDAEGTPVQKMSAAVPATETTPAKAPEPQVFQATNTPAYEMTDEHEAAFDAALTAFLKTPVELTAPPLTSLDLAFIICPGPNGQPMPIPEPVAAALACFTDPL